MSRETMSATDPHSLIDRQVGKYYIQQLRELQQDVAVYTAQDTQAQTAVSLLICLAPEGKEGRFKRHMGILAQLEHPGIPPILESGVTAEKQPYAIIPAISGPSLAAHLAASKTTPTNPPPSPVSHLRLIRQIAGALAVSHAAGLIHQALRPEHIILDETGGPILEGLGLPYIAPPFDPAAEFIDYAAPEQQAGQPATAQSNIYSLGVMLYELLAGHPPHLPQSEWELFDPALPRAPIPLDEARPDLTAVTYALVKKCLYFQEWSRFDTTDQFIGALEQAIAAEEHALTHPPGRWAQWSPKQRLLLVTAVILLLLFTALGVIFLS